MSRTTYERLKNFCEANNISMSQFVETRVGDFLGGDAGEVVHVERPAATERPRPTPMPSAPRSTPAISPSSPTKSTSEARPAPTAPAVVPMTSAAARYAVEPPPPIIKPKQETAAPKPAEKRPDQIFTF